MTGRAARIALPVHESAWAYDAGRRLALVTPAAARGARARALRAAGDTGGRRGGTRRGAGVTAVELSDGAARALRRAGPPVRLLRSLPARIARRSTCWPRSRTGRAAASTSCSASWPAISPSRTLASRSIAASAAAPARPPARPACTTESCSRSHATAARRRPRCRCAHCSRSSSAHVYWRFMLRAGRPLAGLMPGAAGRSGKSLDSHASVTWERRRPGGPPAVVLRGCVMREAFAGAQQAAVDSLAAAGYDVVAGPEQGCCGALHLHNGELTPVRACARPCFRACPTAPSWSRPPPAAAPPCASTTSACSISARHSYGRPARRREAEAAPWPCSTPAICCMPRACARRRASCCAAPATSRWSSRAPGAAAAPPACTRSRSRSSRSSSRAAASRRSAPAAHAS